MSDDENKPLAVSGTRRGMRELADGTIRVQIDIDPRSRGDFLKLFPNIDMPVAMAPLRPDALPPGGVPVGSQAPSSPASRSLAQRLHANGYFRNPKLWRALHEKGIYTLQDHKAMVRAMPCIMQSARCQGDVCGHHCESSALAAAGPEIQPENPQKIPHWYTVPLCHHHHRNWAHGSGPRSASKEDKQALVERAVAITAERVKEVIKEFIGIASLSEITAKQLVAFERAMDLTDETEWG